MYLLYLDDSGSADNKNEEHLVLGGLCVPENSIYWLTSELDKLAKTVCNDDPDSVEFHASAIFGGRVHPWNQQQFREKKQRINMIKQVLLILRNANPDVATFACAVHKASYPGSDPMKLAFEDLTSRFDMYLSRVFRRDNEAQKGIIILDESSHETSLQQEAIRFRQTGTRWRKLNNICEVPFFVDSRASRIIQLADHVAYAVFRRYDADDLAYFNCIEARFDSDRGVIHGLCHKQQNNPTCTCPACLSRPHNSGLATQE
ncbi:MAG: DUF3800 domain-containing protein [Syntrophobacteraceae bacterium]|jgi:hypothetical protein